MMSRKMVRKIGLSERFVTKAAVSILLPGRFYRALTAYRLEDLQKPTSISTISFDCDHVADIEALPRILETLDSHQIKASFACIGKYIERYPRAHRQILERGHEIVNHTYSHPQHDELCPDKRFDLLSEQEQRNEILGCHNVCKKELDYQPIGFRTPHFGKQSSEGVYKILQELGYSYSSSVLAVKSPTFGNPYSINGIFEFPVTVCPRHPLQAFDSYHAFRSRLTSHTNQDFKDAFSMLVAQCSENGLYLNTYFDPQDILESRMLDEILEQMHKNIQTANYGTIVKDKLIDKSEYIETRPHAIEKRVAKPTLNSTRPTKSVSARSSRQLRVCLICAPGGHLTELMRIREAFEGCELSLITYEEGFLSLQEGIDKMYTFKNFYINRMNSGQIASWLIMIRQMLSLLKGGIFIFADRKPDVVLSTGSEIAIPFMYLGKLLGKRIVFIESLCRIKGLSATANIISPVTDILLVQWKNLEGLRQKARFEGNILGPPIIDESNREEEDFILVTVGTAPFPRLVEMMDKYAGDTGRRVIIHLARTQFVPKHAKYFTFVEKNEYDAYFRKAKVIITHGGVGTILSALENGKPTIIVPRLKEFGEHLDNNQLEIAEMIEGEPNVRVVRDVNEIPKALRDFEENPPKNIRYSWEDSRGQLIKFLKNYLDSVKSEIGL